MAMRNKSRPRIQLPVVGGTPTHDMENGNNHRHTLTVHTAGSGMYNVIPLSPSLNNIPLGSIMTPAPITPGGVTIVPGKTTLTDGICEYYPTKASGFVFKQIRGVKDFTLNTAKSGLSVGEKTAFWLYNKISRWSKKWFTHLFLFVVVFAYSLIGAAIFCAIEGAHEQRHLADIYKAKSMLLRELRYLARNGSAETEEVWNLQATKKLIEYQETLYRHYKEADYIDQPKVWTLWNALFYCGTIYTTIDHDVQYI